MWQLEARSAKGRVGSEARASAEQGRRTQCTWVCSNGCGLEIGSEPLDERRQCARIKQKADHVSSNGPQQLPHATVASERHLAWGVLSRTGRFVARRWRCVYHVHSIQVRMYYVGPRESSTNTSIASGIRPSSLVAALHPYTTIQARPFAPPWWSRHADWLSVSGSCVVFRRAVSVGLLYKRFRRSARDSTTPFCLVRLPSQDLHHAAAAVNAIALLLPLPLPDLCEPCGFFPWRIAAMSGPATVQHPRKRFRGDDDQGH